jgi:hypothetical protein
VDSLKALDPNRPIREADIAGRFTIAGPQLQIHWRRNNQWAAETG